MGEAFFEYNRFARDPCIYLLRYKCCQWRTSKGALSTPRTIEIARERSEKLCVGVALFFPLAVSRHVRGEKDRTF